MEDRTLSNAVSSHLKSSALAVVPLVVLAAILSGFRAGSYSMEHIQSGGPPVVLTLLAAWLGGAVIGPLLKDWLPGISLPVKGLMAGLLALAIWPAACLPLHLEPLDVTMAVLVIPAASSVLTTRLAPPLSDAWRKAAPLQLAPIALAAGIWIMARFI